MLRKCKVLWCKNCNRETTDNICELCGNTTEQDIPVLVYWCDNCKTPIIKEANRVDKDVCPLCKGQTTYMSTDIRPVFPEERLLLEILVSKPLAYKNSTVWVSNSRYYIDGIARIVPISIFKKQDVSKVSALLEKYKKKNDYDFFNKTIDKFINANRERLNYLVDESTQFITETVKDYPSENIVISFSGGKDSTVVADLTVRALSNPSLVHIFGDTTLEFPLTIEYVKRFRENNRKAIFKVAKNNERNFHTVCEDIGAYFGTIRTPIPVTCGQRNGYMRTAKRNIRTPCRVNSLDGTL